MEKQGGSEKWGSGVGREVCIEHPLAYRSSVPLLETNGKGQEITPKVKMSSLLLPFRDTPVLLIKLMGEALQGPGINNELFMRLMGTFRAMTTVIWMPIDLTNDAASDGVDRCVGTISPVLPSQVFLAHLFLIKP